MLPGEMRVSPGMCKTGGIPSSSCLPCMTKETGLSGDTLFLLAPTGSQFGSNFPVFGGSWGVFWPRMCLWGCVCEPAGNPGGESPYLAGPRGPPRSSLGTRELGHAVGAGASHLVARRGGPGGSQPLSSPSLLHFNGGGGRRGTSAGMPMSLRGGLLMQGWRGSGWGDGPGSLLLPLSLCCIKLISLALS